MNSHTRHNPSAPSVGHIPLWQRSLPRAGAAAAAFTTLCCLGFTAALSLASAVGATFLTRDATLKPLLVATIILTLVGSAFTYRRHRNPLPLILTALAGAWVFLFTFTIGGTPRSVVWAGLAVFLGVQVWDLVLIRTCRISRRTPEGTAEPDGA
ncbi:MAG: MerC domain-containing protein [Actinomycetota bacterium]|nr:MerC domain-containing protein [Actinomycetota bacterium]